MDKMSRLPGRSVKAFGCSFQRHQLWLAPEYLLYREISGYREDVKRFYYGDIQAIVSGPTRAWHVFNGICAGAVLFGAVALAYILAAGAERLYLFFPGFILAVSLPLLLGNLILGPTCKTTLYTATSEAPLYSLGRKRGAQKAIGRLLPFIEAAQGTLPGPSGPAGDGAEPGAPDGVMGGGTG